VLEERWEAATKQLKSKSRMCIDYSQTLNKKIKKCTYPIPLMDEFRRKVASFECFTNLDASEFYSQLRISERSKKYTGFCACGDLWFYNKTPMGIVPATNYCQAIVEGCCKCHCHLFPYFDDFTTASHGREEMIEKDMPLTLAICSYYNILLSGRKSEILVDSIRILGQEVAEGLIELSPEKEQKIRNLDFPEDKKDLASKLAFFSWFIQSCKKLNHILAPLRDLYKMRKFKPEKIHHDSWMEAKEALLDKTSGATRPLSTDPHDQIIVFTDS
jgi:predicted  nucleic acid-binding Zn-ribbon protein